MGANLSNNSGKNGPPLMSGLEDMPENCVALVLMHMDPPEICKLAGVNRMFRGAASADFIWESKLPCNYQFLMDKALEFNEKEKRTANLRKKDVYSKLCKRNTLNGVWKEFWLNKRTGELSMAISWKALSITGIDDRRYWNHISTEESRFQTIAYLQQTWWLEVNGELKFQFPEGRYAVFFRLHLGKPSKRLGRRVCYTDQVHGWDIKPVRFQLTTSDNQHTESRCFLCSPGNWLNYHVGDFTVESSGKNNGMMKLKFSLTQIDCTHTKGGLCLDSVLIRPSTQANQPKYRFCS
ncbi:F-box protein PP2-A13-like [Cucurbita moschata]|uniref:F-box protein PP2-A13-like n=1 Tax=Cucurbita moschata TaxID=3662 RepID=A0A6J1ECW2_CUCMO|nr:F-box protein PP2-A13-like [Cucurbita moschata]